MGRVLLAALPPSERAAWVAGCKPDARTDRTITDTAALNDALELVARPQWSLVEEELAPGLRSLAVPVRDRSGAVVAALNVATFSHAPSRAHVLKGSLPDLRPGNRRVGKACVRTCSSRGDPLTYN